MVPFLSGSKCKSLEEDSYKKGLKKVYCCSLQHLFSQVQSCTERLFVFETIVIDSNKCSIFYDLAEYLQRAQ